MSLESMCYEPYTCNLDPDTKTTLKVYFYKNVQNVEEIRTNIIQGAWKCSVIKPSLILDLFQVAVAANRAVLAAKSQSIITRSVYTEILFNLSPSKKISQSLSKFGVEKDQSFLLCFLVTTEDDESENVIKQVKGDLSPISDLEKHRDMIEIKNTYKLNNLKSNIDILDVIVTKMVTKNLIVH